MATRPLFQDRRDAGMALARALSGLAHRSDVVVLGMARGGVPVARPVADALAAPFDVAVARKLGVPGVPEVALGAIAEGSSSIVYSSIAWYIGVPSDVVARIAARERVELERRVGLYRGDRRIPEIGGRTVVLVDDGAATGATLRAAARALRAKGPARLIVTVPVASTECAAELGSEVDELVALATPEDFGTVSQWYHHFPAVHDDEVIAQLGRTVHVSHQRPFVPCPETPDEGDIVVPVAGGSIAGDFGRPDAEGVGIAGRADVCRGLVILAHGGGSSRHSYRNRYLAARLRLAGYSTLRLDLLVESEREADKEGALRFDVHHIAQRLVAAVDWAVREQVPGADRIVLMGASTGAAAALVAAAERPALVTAVVSRGGRVDLAGDAIRRAAAKVLLIVGANDRDTLRLNRRAMRVRRGGTQLRVIPGAGHIFEEPGALGAVGEAAVTWLDAPGRSEAGAFKALRHGVGRTLEFLGLRPTPQTA